MTVNVVRSLLVIELECRSDFPQFGKFQIILFFTSFAMVQMGNIPAAILQTAYSVVLL